MNPHIGQGHDAAQAPDFERNHLRTEIQANKKLVFERALLLAGVALATSLLSTPAKGAEWLGLPAIGALAFNLWFTVNRLRSNARIIAYVQLFHESETMYPWLGWETALRYRRIWLASCCEERTLAESRFNQITEYDNLGFFKPILALHLTTAFAVAGLVSLRAWVDPTSTPAGQVPIPVFCGINFAVAILFAVWTFHITRPTEVRIEQIGSSGSHEVLHGWLLVHSQNSLGSAGVRCQTPGGQPAISS